MKTHSLATTNAADGATPELLHTLRQSVDQLITNCTPFHSRLGLRFDTRYALWDGQNDAATKTEEGAFPWPGASDARVRLADEIIRERNAIRNAALSGKRVQARALQPLNTGMAQIASAFMKALLYVHAGPMVRQETELGWSYMDTYGAAVMGCYWRQETRLQVKEFNMEELLANPAPEVQLIASLVTDPLKDAFTIPILAKAFPSHTQRELKGFLRRLRETGLGTLRTPEITVNTPQWHAMRPFIDVFFDPTLDDAKRAPLIVCRELIPVHEAYDRIGTEGWSEDFVVQLEKQKGRMSLGGADPLRWQKDPSGNYQSVFAEDTSDRVEVLRSFYHVREREGTALYQTITHQGVKDLAGMHVLMDYDHGQMPFHFWRFETTEREVASSRGVPEICLTWQQEKKNIHDAYVDRASMEVIPTLLVPRGEAGSVLIGAGQQIEQRRSGDYSYLQTPQMSNTLDKLDATSEMEISRYFGRFHPSLDPILITAHRQTLADNTLADLVPLVSQTASLATEYMSEQEQAAMAGPQTAQALKTEAKWAWEYDVRTMDPKHAETTVELIGKIIPLDRSGRINIDEAVSYLMESIHPDLAARLLMPREDAALEQVRKTQERLVLALNGIEPPDNTLPAGDPEMQTKIIQQALQSPLVQAILKNDPTGISAQLYEREFALRAGQMQQQKNAFTGRSLVPSLQGNDSTGMPMPRGIKTLEEAGMGELTGGAQ